MIGSCNDRMKALETSPARDLITHRNRIAQRNSCLFLPVCRSGKGKPSGLLKGHPAKLLKSSRVKPSGAVFDRQKLQDIYKTEMYCESL